MGSDDKHKNVSSEKLKGSYHVADTDICQKIILKQILKKQANYCDDLHIFNYLSILSIVGFFQQGEETSRCKKAGDLQSKRPSMLSSAEEDSENSALRSEVIG
jgi:hypothetical protein